VRGADEPVCGAAHLTLPTLRLGPSLSPLKGGEGLVSTGIILVEHDASHAIEFSSPYSPAACGGGNGGGVVLPVDAVLRNPGVQYLEPLLALAAADDLADFRREHVPRRDWQAVVELAGARRRALLRPPPQGKRLR
jgi:hypothetical protein